MGLTENEINTVFRVNLTDGMKTRLKELIKNPYGLSQKGSGCCSFAAINMGLLKYNQHDKGTFLKDYINTIIGISKSQGTLFKDAMESRIQFFFSQPSQPPSMDFFLNIGLLTMFMREHKFNNRRIKLNRQQTPLWDDILEYTKAFGKYYTDKFKSGIKANITEANFQAGNYAGITPINPGSSSSESFFLKKGDLANTWEGLQKAFEVAVNAGGKEVFFNTLDIGACDISYESIFAPGSTVYKNHYKKQIELCRDWAKKKDTRFLIAGVFSIYGIKNISAEFAKFEKWKHVNHYVFLPRRVHDSKSDFYAASWGVAKDYGAGMVPRRILQAEIF